MRRIAKQKTRHPAAWVEVCKVYLKGRPMQWLFANLGWTDSTAYWKRRVPDLRISELTEMAAIMEAPLDRFLMRVALLQRQKQPTRIGTRRQEWRGLERKKKDDRCALCGSTGHVTEKCRHLDPERTIDREVARMQAARRQKMQK